MEQVFNYTKIYLSHTFFKIDILKQRDRKISAMPEYKLHKW